RAKQEAQWYTDAANMAKLAMDQEALAAINLASKTHGATVELGKNTKGHQDHGPVVEHVIALTAEEIHINELLALAKAHEKAQIEFAASAWKQWESIASTALKNVEKNSAPLMLLTRDLSSFAPLVNAGAGNMTGYRPPPEA